MKKLERLDRKLVVEGKLFKYYHDTVRVADGDITTFDFIGHKGAAAILPVRDDGKILMVRQYRNALDRETLEIPAGGLEEKDRTSMEAAARELREETGYSSKDLEWLITIRTTVAFCNEKIDIYVARNLTPGKQDLDKDEDICVEAYTLEELCEMIYSGKMEDSKTIAAIMSYKNKCSE